MCWGIGLVILSGLRCRRTQLDPLSRIICFYCLSVNLVVCTALARVPAPGPAQPRYCLFICPAASA